MKKNTDKKLMIGGAATYGLAHKFHSDVNRALGHGDDWVAQTDPMYKTLSEKKHITPDEAEQMVREYHPGGQRFAQSRILGVPIGTAAKIGRPFQEEAKIKGKPVHKKIRDAIRDPKNRRGHYRLYTSKKSTPQEFRRHHLKDMMIRSRFGDVQDDPKVFSSEANKILNDKNNTYSQVIEKLRGGGHHEAADYTEAAITGKKIGKLDPKHSGMHELITEQKAPHRYLGAAQKALKYPLVAAKLAKPLALGAAGLGAAMFAKKQMQKRGSLIDLYMYKYARRSRRKKNALTSTTVGAGALGATGLGMGHRTIGAINRYKNLNNDIVVTYGQQPHIGAGHQGPGKAIANILRSAQTPGTDVYDPFFAKSKIYEAPRNEAGILVRPQELLNRKPVGAVVHTGFGSGSAVGSGTRDSTLGGKGDKLKVKRPNTGIVGADIPGHRHIAYLTDIKAKGQNPNSITIPEGLLSSKGGFGFITYGPNAEELKSIKYGGPFVKHYNVSPGGSPAIERDVVENMMHDTRGSDEVLNAIHEGLSKNNPVVSTETYKHRGKEYKYNRYMHSQRDLDAIKNAKGKKLIVVAGSGRGDYVGSRALDLHRKLKASGLDKEYKVVALLAGGHGGPQHEMIKGTDIVAVPKVSPELYNAIQNKAHTVWASTGTSAMSEGMHHKAVQAVPKWWGGHYDPLQSNSIFARDRALMAANGYTVHGESIKDNPIKERLAKIRGDMSDTGVYLDRWNRGNIEFAHTQPGVVPGSNAGDIVDYLKNPEAVAAQQQGALTRRASAYKNTVEGQKKIVEAVKSELKGNISRGRRSILLNTLATIGAFGGGYQLLKHDNKPIHEVFHKQGSVVKPLLLGTGLGAAGGAAVAPKDERVSGAIKGGLFGALTGGLGRGLVSVGKAKFRGKPIKGVMKKSIERTSGKESATSAGVNTALTAAANSLTGAYSGKKHKHPIIRTLAPLADDAAILGLTALRAA